MDENGMLSVDFLAGFTIFLLALILVIAMIPGILVGIRSTSIDYDAVAYRTGAILVEDPGWPSNPAWDQMDSLHKDEIERLGLAISKNSPNILSRNKVSKFFNKPEYFNFTDMEYETKVIFADIPYFPYGYNISLKIAGEETLSKGGDVPESSYGYIRRLVKVKNESYADIDCLLYDNQMQAFKGEKTNWTKTTSLLVRLDFDELRDRTIPEAYRIDPSKEPLSITLNNFSGSITNATDVTNITLDSVEYWKEGATDRIPYNYSAWDNESYLLYDLKEGEDPKQIRLIEPQPYYLYNSTVSNTTSLNLRLEPPLPFSTQTDFSFLVNFTFTYDFLNSTHDHGHHYIGGTHNYDYDPDNVHLPELKDGVLEVVIW